MKLRISGLLAIAGFALAGILGGARSVAQNAYITNLASGNVSVIDTATNTVIATIPLPFPGSLAVAPDGSKVYVGNGPGPGTGGDKISVIDTASNTVTATISGFTPFGVAVAPDGSKVYVANEVSNTVSVINAASNTVTATIPLAGGGFDVAVTPDGSRVYATTFDGNTVAVIDATSNTVIASAVAAGTALHGTILPIGCLARCLTGGIGHVHGSFVKYVGGNSCQRAGNPGISIRRKGGGHALRVLRPAALRRRIFRTSAL